MGNPFDEFTKSISLDDIKKQMEAYTRRHGIDIAVIDDSDFTGWSASVTRTDEVYMSDVKSVVANVLKAKGPYAIRRLDILDHGNEYRIQIGDDRIDLNTLQKFKADLSKLKGQFSAGGFVHLQHCDIGVNKELLVALAKLWGVPVYAGTGKHNPVYRVNFGEYVRADPDGAVRPAGRPDQDTYQSYPGMKEGESAIPPASEEQRMSSRSSAKDSPPPPAPKPKVKLIK
jgi:Domain of unknown function (DUF4347)